MEEAMRRKGNVSIVLSLILSKLGQDVKVKERTLLVKIASRIASLSCDHGTDNVKNRNNKMPRGLEAWRWMVNTIVVLCLLLLFSHVSGRESPL